MSYETVTYFAHAYFHQDYYLTAEAPIGVADLFKNHEDPKTVAELVGELDDLIERQLPESMLEEIWMEQGRASFNPTVYGQSFNDWLIEIRSRLSS